LALNIWHLTCSDFLIAYFKLNFIYLYDFRYIREKGNEYKFGLENPTGRLGRPRHRWEDKSKIDLGEIGRGDVDWIHLAQYWYQ
jgi:hypothetical protein